jgi:hypothetical protein
MAVVWKLSLFNAEAEKVNADLENISEKTPENIVDYAESHTDSELYKCFTWDDTKAAREYRKQEARKVLQLLVYSDDEAEAEEREPIQVRVYQRGEVEYKPAKLIIQNKGEYAKLLERAYAELQAFKERYKNIAELEEVLLAIDGALLLK